jgi:hypothetical protein
MVVDKLPAYGSIMENKKVADQHSLAAFSIRLCGKANTLLPTVDAIKNQPTQRRLPTANWLLKRETSQLNSVSNNC